MANAEDQVIPRTAVGSHEVDLGRYRTAELASPAVGQHA
jgi:hypothetical protein